MEDLQEIKKGISDIKLSIIIAVLVAFFISSAFVWVMIIRKIDDVKIIVNEIDDKSLDYRYIAE